MCSSAVLLSSLELSDTKVYEPETRALLAGVQVEPMIEILVGSTLQQSLMECDEEDMVRALPLNCPES